MLCLLNKCSFYFQFLCDQIFTMGFFLRFNVLVCPILMLFNTDSVIRCRCALVDSADDVELGSIAEP